mmetsp:Transcript_859/g.2375  ORF Transcript_859/g.2375 Transcript_859/m.2375 type:complete len:87 (+) Transcript_859:2167-2427(+)
MPRRQNRHHFSVVRALCVLRGMCRTDQGVSVLPQANLSRRALAILRRSSRTNVRSSTVFVEKRNDIFHRRQGLNLRGKFCHGVRFR